ATCIQRALIYLSYPTGIQGNYSIDGDFGAGTNKGLAHFLREWDMNELRDENGNMVGDDKLILPATYKTVKTVIPTFNTIPVKQKTIEILFRAVIKASEKKEIYLRDVEKAANNLDSIQNRSILSVNEIIDELRNEIKIAANYGKTKGFDIKPWWIAAFVKTETGGLPRPKFEHHWLYNYYSKKTNGGKINDKTLVNIRECRFNSTSFGLGQLMGANHTVTNLATSATELFYMSEEEQLKVMVDFLFKYKDTCSVVLKADVEDASEVEACVKTYNGPSYKTNDYHNLLYKYVKQAIKHW
ncbi:MAG: N-acetylmuramidase domain-containing protein, partial [Bacteroidota bacterium]